MSPTESMIVEAGKKMWNWIVKPIGLFFAFCMRLAGPFFIFAFYYLIYLHIDVFLRLIIKVLYKRLGVSFGNLWLLVGAILGFNVVFNHSMAAYVKANGPTEVRLIEKLRLEYKHRQTKKDADLENNDRFAGLSQEIKKTLRYRSKSLDSLKPVWNRMCNKCNELKPARTHHCAVCGRCVFMMDHHCPWVNNCVGMENYRYFLLFIFYLMIGSIWYGLTIVSIWDHHIYKDNKGEISFLLITNSSLSAMLVGFNFWNWYLACSGITTIEFMKKFHLREENVFDYSYNTIADNLFVIFGTHKLIRVLSPSLRALPMTGIEFSF